MISEKYRLFDVRRGGQISSEAAVCALPPNALDPAGPNGQGGYEEYEAYAERWGSVELYDPGTVYRATPANSLPERKHFVFTDLDEWSYLEDLRVVSREFADEGYDYSDPQNAEEIRGYVERYGSFPMVDSAVNTLQSPLFERVAPLPRWYQPVE